MKTVNQFINGKEHISKSNRFGDVFNPANGEIIKKVSFANTDDVKLAIDCAVDAGKKWAATPSLTRSRVFFKFKDFRYCIRVCCITTNSPNCIAWI